MLTGNCVRRVQRRLERTRWASRLRKPEETALGRLMIDVHVHGRMGVSE
jgi:hypothetical protein